MKNHITWDHRSYLNNGKRFFLVSGEFHYFRVPPQDWRRRLELFLETGGNAVATYIPWLVHEPEEGTFRFGDKPERDLEAFLDLCNELDIAVVARPGPYQYSELRYHGTPGWLWKKYPGIAATDQMGNVRGTACASYLHPVFLEKVDAWFAEVCPILAKHMASGGGPIAFVQFDNELMGIHDWFGGWDYNRVTMGIGSKGGRYPRFLSERYGTVEELNAACELNVSDFSEVEPFPARMPESVAERRRVKDYCDFYFGTVAEYAVTLAKMMRKHGIDCDFVHNAGGPYMNPFFRETVRRMEGRLILGSDHYYNLDMDWDQNNPTPKYISKIFYSLELLRLMGCPPTIWELPGGSAADWPPMTPQDWRACYLGNIAFGMKGSNYYIFTGGPNPPGCGMTGEIYDFGASIAADGTIRRPLYDVQQAFGAFLKDHAWLADADRVGDFNIGVDWNQTVGRYYFNARGNLGFSTDEAWTMMRKGMMISALCASYSPNLVDLFSDDYPTGKPLWVAASVCMAREVQERLVRFVQDGGRLLIAPVIPHLDENFNPCTVLGDFLEGAAVKRCEEQFPVLNVGPVRNVYTNAGLWQSVSRPSKAETIASDVVSGAETGWKQTFPGGGSIIWLGLGWKHHRNEHLHMVAWLLSQQGCAEPVVNCDNRNIWTSLRSDGHNSILFVLNLYSSPMKAGIKVRLRDTIVDTGEHDLAPMEVKIVELAGEDHGRPAVSHILEQV